MKDIKKYLDEEREGKYAFYFGDLDGEYVYKYNEEQQITSAGCMKLMVAMSVLKKVEEGNFSLDELILVSDKDKKEGNGILREFIERSYTIKELIIAMLTIGDNTASSKLMDLLGRSEINGTFKDMGLEKTYLSETPGSKENKTTAKDMAQIINLLYHASYLSKENSDFVIELLRGRIKSKIAFYLDYPLRQKFASKTGDAEGIENEVALINTDKGNFVFSIMSEDLPNSVYGMMSLAKSGMMMWDRIQNNWANK